MKVFLDKLKESIIYLSHSTEHINLGVKVKKDYGLLKQLNRPDSRPPAFLIIL